MTLGLIFASNAFLGAFCFTLKRAGQSSVACRTWIINWTDNVIVLMHLISIDVWNLWTCLPVRRQTASGKKLSPWWDVLVLSGDVQGGSSQRQSNQLCSRHWVHKVPRWMVGDSWPDHSILPGFAVRTCWKKLNFYGGSAFKGWCNDGRELMSSSLAPNAWLFSVFNPSFFISICRSAFFVSVLLLALIWTV